MENLGLTGMCGIFHSYVAHVSLIFMIGINFRSDRMPYSFNTKLLMIKEFCSKFTWFTCKFSSV